MGKSQAVNSPIYRGDEEKKDVSLMFNVYWGTEYIEKILDILDEYNVKSTFFIGGVWAVKEENTLNEIVKRGHELGNHGYYHKDMAKMSYDDCCKEIANTNKLIEKLSNVMTTLFAPPSGSYSKITLQACEDVEMDVIMWSKDTIDWRDKDNNLIYKRATTNIANGDLILMHPTEMTVKALPKILKFYKENEYNATTVTKTIGDDLKYGKNN
ncbi:MAG: polysaccharide deacetylase family protein [Clostridia bacterium]